MVDMRDAALIRYCHFPVDDRGPDRQLTQPFRGGRKTSGRVITRPTDQLHHSALDRGDDAVPIVLDLVKPAFFGVPVVGNFACPCRACAEPGRET
jgi:hypothetical protein